MLLDKFILYVKVVGHRAEQMMLVGKLSTPPDCLHTINNINPVKIYYRKSQNKRIINKSSNYMNKIDRIDTDTNVAKPDWPPFFFPSFNAVMPSVVCEIFLSKNLYL